MPRLTHLRLAINFRCGSTKVLDDHVLFEYPLLTHVYLSIYVAEGMDVADHVRQLRTPVTVQTLAIEVNMGQNLPVECHALWQYDIHPKVVFMVDKEWEQHASRGLEEREWEQVNQCLCLFSENQWREEQAQSLMLVKAGGRSDIWEEIDIKVKQRWSDFDEGFAAFEEERKEVLANPNHFVSLNVFS
ncbi:hypothetical protein VNI00_014749 [Paramarasmius palmivorus]|uniref:Uncharacterized protein n=1 Tax=Paramarasmius palmivorus TaxID=297713 RepID=A0AAW0BR73_9AGAR